MEASPLPPPLHMAPSFATVSAARLGGQTRHRAGAADDCAQRRAPCGSLERRATSRCSRGCRSTARRIARFAASGKSSWSARSMKNSTASTRGTASMFSGKRFFRRATDIASGFRAFRSEICTTAAARRSTQRGGEVQLRAGVRGFRVADGSESSGVEREDGSVETADYYLAAVPQDVLPELLPAGDCGARAGVFKSCATCGPRRSPGCISGSIETVMSEPFLDAARQHDAMGVQQDATVRRRREDGGQYLQLVISASYGLAPRSRQEIHRAVSRGIAGSSAGDRARATLVKGTVVKEMSATFSPAPGSDRWRPAQKSPLRYRTYFSRGTGQPPGWPSTMEGAVRSGYLAAEAILSDARSATEIFATGFARGRIGALVGQDLEARRKCTIFTDLDASSV